jgi:hypothetical protein
MTTRTLKIYSRSRRGVRYESGAACQSTTLKKLILPLVCGALIKMLLKQKTSADTWFLGLVIQRNERLPSELDIEILVEGLWVNDMDSQDDETIVALTKYGCFVIASASSKYALRLENRV